MPTDGQNLCLSCGLCCDGTLYERAPVAAAEPVEAFWARGMRITPDSGRGGRYWLPLPCLRFENGRCQTYGCRPRICSSYRCRLLRRVEAGEMTLLEGQGVVQLARERRRRCRRLPEKHFPELAGEALARALRIVEGRMADMDESRRRRFREAHGEFLLVAVSLEESLDRDFRLGRELRRMNGPWRLEDSRR